MYEMKMQQNIADIDKTTIEFFRYIDALHHQLAARLNTQNSSSTSNDQSNESRRDGSSTFIFHYFIHYLVELFAFLFSAIQFQIIV